MQALGLIGINITTPGFRESTKWLKKYFNYKYKLFSYFSADANYDSKIMILVNKNGGLPLLLSQDLRSPQFIVNSYTINDLGPIAYKAKTPNLDKLYLWYKTQKIPTFSKILETPYDTKIFWTKDPFGNNFIYEQEEPKIYSATSDDIKGISGIIIGVKNIAKAINFYTGLGYELVSQTKVKSPDLQPAGAEENKAYSRALLRSNQTDHILKSFVQDTTLELIEVNTNSSNKFNPVPLLFLIDQPQINYDKNIYYKAIDTDNFSVLYAEKEDPSTGVYHKLLDIQRLRFSGVFNFNIKYPKTNLFRQKRFNFLTNNALEKI